VARDPGADRQRYVERPPRVGLRGLVRSVWVQQVAPDAGPLPHRNVPHGGVEIVAVAGVGVRVLGPLTRCTDEVLAPGTTVVGVRMEPAAARPVLGRPAADLLDGIVDAERLWGDAGARLSAAAAGARPAAAAGLLQQALLDRTAAAPVDPVVAEVVRRLQPGRSRGVRDVADAVAVSGRQLRRRCRAATGLAPKELHVILRFQGFLALAQYAVARGRRASDDGVGLLAAHAGYADQSHLTRDCLRLTGLPPGAFLRELEPRCACGHDHSAAFAPLVAALLRRR
jgi:AraC-like DNA-binding protein